MLATDLLEARSCFRSLLACFTRSVVEKLGLTLLKLLFVTRGMECPRCGADVTVYRLGSAVSRSCTDCEFVGITVDHHSQRDDTESWDTALTRFRDQPEDDTGQTQDEEKAQQPQHPNGGTNSDDSNPTDEGETDQSSGDDSPEDDPSTKDEPTNGEPSADAPAESSPDEPVDESSANETAESSPDEPADESSASETTESSPDESADVSSASETAESSPDESADDEPSADNPAGSDLSGDDPQES